MNIAPSRPITSSAEELAAPVTRTTGETIRPDLRNVVAAELSALLHKEANRRNNEWRASLELVRGALLALDRAWGAGDGKLESPAAASAVSDLVDVIVAAAHRDTDAAVRQARVEAQVEIGRLVDLTGRLTAELQAERDQLKMAGEAINAERGLRARAEAACREAERDRANLSAQLAAHSEAAQAELETGRALVAELRRQIEAEKVERAKLFAVVQTVQRAVSPAETTATGSLASAVNPHELLLHTDRAPVPMSLTGPAQILAQPQVIVKEARATEPANRQTAPEKLWNPALVALTERLFEEIERAYTLDVQANLTPADVVDRLLANLRIGHADLRRSCSSDAEASGLFERQMMMLLDSKAATTFGRHLSIAACQWVVPDDGQPMNG